MSQARTVGRRQILRGIGAAAIAPAFIPATSLGTTTRPAPSERLTVGIIGPGKMGLGFHVKTLLGFPDVQLVAVCEVDTTRRQYNKKLIEDHYAESYGSRDYHGCGEYNDFRDMLARRDIDAVVIATPDHWHAIPLIEACKAGKDVYCEKPLTRTIAEAKRCIEAARKHRRVVQTGSQQRSSVFGPFRLACEIVRSGRLGRVHRVTVGVGEASRWCDLPEEPAEPGLDWDLWLGAAPMRPYNSALSPRGMHDHFPAWRSYREYGGSGLCDMGAHHFDIAQWALNMDDSGPVKIIPPDDPKAEFGTKFIYANGIEMEHVRKPGGCVFHGEHGTLRIDRDLMTSDPEEIAKEPIGESEVHLPVSPGHHRDWINCIRSGGRPIADVEVGARSATICHLGSLAYWYRQTLDWNPQEWRFGSAQANEWLDCPRRDPWPLPEA